MHILIAKNVGGGILKRRQKGVISRRKNIKKSKEYIELRNER